MKQRSTFVASIRRKTGGRVNSIFSSTAMAAKIEATKWLLRHNLNPDNYDIITRELWKGPTC